MSRIFYALNDPELVVRFQHFCGIRKRTTNSISKTKSESDLGSADRQSSPSHTDRHAHANGSIKVKDQVESTITDVSNGVSLNTVRIRKHTANGDDAKQGRETWREEPATAAEPGPAVQPEADSVSDSDSTSISETEPDYIIEDGLWPKILYCLFSFGASLGNEIFYITFYPFWFWNCDSYVGRRICFFWCMFMYLGQATKDIIRIPRPSSPPVIRMEKRYALEYGLPSTHTMVGAGFPFGILLLTYGRYEYPLALGVLVAASWCLLVALSRMYLGMHSLLDIVAGLAYILLLIPVVFPFLDTIDHFILTSPYSPSACILVPLALCICYPTLDKWSTARGDTTVIMAVGAGLNLGSWICCQYHLMEYGTASPPFQILMPDGAMLARMVARLVVGVSLLVVTRAALKALSYNLVCKLTGTSKQDLKASQKLVVELPYKFITYMLIAVNSSVLCPYVFRVLGIQRESFYSEL